MYNIDRDSIVYNWKVLEVDSGLRYRTKILSKCICLECNEIQFIRKEQLVNGRKVKCKKCREIFLQSQIGKKYNRWTIISFSHSNGNNIFFNCICDCGTARSIRLCELIRGGTKSCGCLHKEIVSNNSTQHGLSKHRLYGILLSMKQRCGNANNSSYDKYGGRGIFICDEWLDKEYGFINFYNWSINNGYQEDLTIDRIDNDGPYAPWNCRWATMPEQCINRRTNHCVDIYGELLTLSQISIIYNINYSTLWHNLDNGNSIYDIIKDRKINVVKFL